MATISINFPSGIAAPESGGTLTYCCGTYTTDGIPSGAAIEVLGKVYQPGDPLPADPPGSASGASLGAGTWDFAGGLGGANSSTDQQIVRVWLVVDGVTEDYADATFDPCIEGTSGCPTPAVCGGEALAAAAATGRACVIDSIAPRVFELHMDLAWLVREPVRTLLEAGLLQTTALALTYDADRSNWDAEVWSSPSGLVRMRVVRSDCGTQLHAEVMLLRPSPRGIRSPLRWVCRQFSLLKGGAFTLASAPRGVQLGDISVQPCA
ncbi:MAG: hypothetical protein L0211_00545 [Planctomycetaceae bacterium]|nr:hypothetical protein [Planctomycetaceae bacterium]